jgi:hypothetical protein
MKITVPKSTVEAALAPILKMAAGTRLPVNALHTLAFRQDRQHIWLSCSLPGQQLSLAMPDAACDEKVAGFNVLLEPFQSLLAAAAGTIISIERDVNGIVLGCDGRILGRLTATPASDEKPPQTPKDADITVLPTNFAGFVLQAFSCAAEKDIPALTGVNVSSQGIAATDGKQLFHLPLPLQLKGDVTLPRSKVYTILKNLRWTSLAHWKTAGGEWMFAIAGDGFRYAANAMNVRYPQYRQVIPPEGAGDVSFTLTADGAKSLRAFLDGNREEAFATLTVHRDRIEIVETSGKELKSRSGTFEARSSSAGLPHAVSFNTCYLRQFLKMGFQSLSFPSKTTGPLVSSSGVGKYLFMPIGTPPGSRTPAPATASAPTPTPSHRTVPEAIVNPTTSKPSKIQPKEKPTMNQTITTPTAPSANSTSFSRVQPAVQANPLDETLASLAAIREQLSDLESRLLEAGRKIKAALVEQKLKERQYADATKKLERIRLAV